MILSKSYGIRAYLGGTYVIRILYVREYELEFFFSSLVFSVSLRNLYKECRIIAFNRVWYMFAWNEKRVLFQRRKMRAKKLHAMYGTVRRTRTLQDIIMLPTDYIFVWRLLKDKYTRKTIKNTPPLCIFSGEFRIAKKKKLEKNKRKTKPEDGYAAGERRERE